MNAPRKSLENDLIRKIRGMTARSADSRSGVKVGIGDDAALFVPRSGYQTILTCDWFLEETHFLRDKHPADSVGWKSLARAVSDIAAMGGQPRCFLLSLALPIRSNRAVADGISDRYAARLAQTALRNGGRRHNPPAQSPYQYNCGR